MKAHAYLLRADHSAMSSIRKLSSGLRIDQAKDDAAGLAMANNIRAEVRSLVQAQRNSGNAISLLQIAEGSVAQIENILVRMKELAVQRQSDNTSVPNKGIIDVELDALMEEIDRIAASTQYQGSTLLDGTFIADVLVDLVSGGQADLLAVTLGDLRAAALFQGSLYPSVTSADLGIVSLTGSEPAGTYAVDVTTTTVMTRSTVITDAAAPAGDVTLVTNPDTAPAGSYAIDVNTTTTRNAYTDDPSDLTVVVDGGSSSAGTFNVDLTTTLYTTAGSTTPALTVTTDPATAPAGSYDVHLQTTTTRSSSSTTPTLTVTGDGSGTAAADTYSVHLDVVNTRVAGTDDPTDLTVVTDSGASPVGTHDVQIETTTFRSTSGAGDVAVAADPNTAAAGTYDVTLDIGTSRTAAQSGDVNLLDGGLATGAVAGTYDVLLDTSRVRSTSTTDPALTTVTSDGYATADPGTYTLELITNTTRVAAVNDTVGAAGDLTLLVDSGTSADGTYAINLDTTTFRTTSGTGDVGVVTDPATAPAGSYNVELDIATNRTTSTVGDVAVVDDGLASGAVADTYDVHLDTTRVRTDSTTTALLTVTDDGYATAVADTYTVTLQTTTDRLVTATDTSGPADFGLVTDSGTSPDGTYAVEVQTTTMRSTTTAGSVSLLTDPNTAPAGTYDVTFDIGTQRSESTSSVDLTVVDDGLATGAVAGTYDVELTTTTTRSTSTATGQVTVVADGFGTAAAGSYAIDLITELDASTSTADLTVVTDPMTAPAGSYSVVIDTTVTRNESVTGDAALTLNTTNGAPEGTYAVNITAAATAASVTGSIVSDGTVHASGPPSATHLITFTDQNGASAAVGITKNSTDAQAVTDLNAGFAAAGLTITAAISGGVMVLSSTAPKGSSSWFTVDASAASDPTILSSNYGISDGTYTGTNVQGTIGGYAATGVDTDLTVSGGVLAGLSVDFSGTATGAVGDVVISNSYSYTASINGEAATYDAGTGVITGGAGTFSSYQLDYQLAAPTVAGPTTVGQLVITEYIIDGTIGGEAATWDSGAQQLVADGGTTAAGLTVSYTGAATSGTIDTVTLTDTTSITGAQFRQGASAYAASYNAATGEATGTDPAVNGLVVDYSGAVPGPTGTYNVGSVTLTDANIINAAYINGEAATVDDALNPTTITGSGTFTGYQLSYTGTFSSLAQGTNDVGDLVVSQWDQITGATIGGEAATWDAVAQTITGNTGTSHDGMAFSYTGAPPGGTGTYQVGTFEVAITEYVIDGTFTDSDGNVHAGTWNAATSTLAGDGGTDADGLQVQYSGANPGPAGSYVIGDVTLSDQDVITGGHFLDFDGNTHLGTWDAVAGTLTGNGGTDATGLVVDWTGVTPPGDPGGLVGSVTLTDANVVNAVYINGEAATVNDALNPTSITGGAGTFSGYELSYGGAISSLAQGMNTVGTLNVTQWDEITGGSIGGVAATWDNTAKTLTGTGAHSGMVVEYTGTVPGGTGTYYAGDLEIAVTDTIVDAQYRDSGGTVHAATWDAGTGTATGDAGTAAEGLGVQYSGGVPGPSGVYAIADITVADADVVTGGSFRDSGGTLWSGTWDSVAGTLTGNAGGSADGIVVEWTGVTPPTSPGGVVGQITLTDADVVNAAYINGEAATVDDALNPTTITGSGTFTGYQLSYTGTFSSLAQDTNDVGDLVVSQWDEITGATIGGEAATWDNVAQTLTGTGTHSGMVLSYTGPVPGPTGSYDVGDLIITGGTAISGGHFVDSGGNTHSATWDAVAQTLTGDVATAASGMEVTYSGSTPPAGAGNYIGDVTLADTTAITGATVNGESATWDNATQTITGDPATTLAGYEIQYSGPVPGPTGNYNVGAIDVTGVTEVTGGSIGGVGGTWNNATQELAGAGVFAGTVLSYTGAPMAGTVGQFIVDETTTVTGAALNGESATYNAATGEITGDPATTLAGYVIDYSGPAPGPTGSYTVGSVDIAETPTTTLSAMTVGGSATTVSGNTATVTAGPLAGTVLEYTGGPLAGYAGDFVVPDGDANLISGIEDALEQVWALQGRIGAYVNRFDFAADGVENKILAMRSAESTIRDLDHASELSSLMKAAIVRTYATAMLAQANAATSSILGLLGGKAQVRRVGGARGAASLSPTMGFTPGFSGGF